MISLKRTPADLRRELQTAVGNCAAWGSEMPLAELQAMAHAISLAHGHALDSADEEECEKSHFAILLAESLKEVCSLEEDELDLKVEVLKASLFVPEEERVGALYRAAVTAAFFSNESGGGAVTAGDLAEAGAVLAHLAGFRDAEAGLLKAAIALRLGLIARGGRLGRFQRIEPAVEGIVDLMISGVDEEACK